MDAQFLKDKGDLIGKQDPFFQFKYNGKTFRTKTHWEGGLYGNFNQEFYLEMYDIYKGSIDHNNIIFEAYDEDPFGFDFLCCT